MLKLSLEILRMVAVAIETQKGGIILKYFKLYETFLAYVEVILSLGNIQYV